MIRLPTRSSPPRWPLAAAALVFAVLLALPLAYLRGEALDDEARHLTTLARTLDIELTREIETAALTLETLATAIDHTGVERIGDRHLEILEQAMDGIGSISIVDAAGIVRRSSQASLIGLDLGDRPYFADARSGTTVGLSAPFTTADGHRGMNLTRRLTGPGGGFGGVITMSLDPDRFRALVSGIRNADDMFAGIADIRGNVYLVSPKIPALVGANVDRPGSFFRRHRESGRQETVFGGRKAITDEDMLVVQRTVFLPAPAASLNVAVGRDRSRILEHWRQQLAMVGGLYLLGLGLSIAGLRHAERNRTARAAAEQELARRNLALSDAEAIASLGNWQVEFGRDDRPDRWTISPELRRIYGLADDEPVTTDSGFATMPEDERIRVGALWAAAIDESGPAEWEHRIVVGGETRWVFVRVRFERDGLGRAARASGIVQDITRRKATEELLAAQQHRLQAVMDHVPALIGYVDAQLDFRFANRGYADWFGRDPAMQVGRPIREAIGDALFETNLPHMQRALAGEAQRFGRQIPAGAGGTRHVELQYIPDRAGPEVVGFFVFGVDVSAARNAELALSASVARFDDLVRRIPVGVFVLEMDASGPTALRYGSPRFFELLGVDGIAAQREVGVCFSTLHPEDRADALAACLAAARSPGPFRWAGRFVVDGSVRWLSIRSAPEMLEAGRSAWNGVIIDITEQRIAEEQVRETLERATTYARALDEVPAYIFMKDPEGRYTYANRMTLELFGKPAGEVVGQGDEAFFDAEFAARLRAIDREVMAGGEITRREVEGDTRDGAHYVYWEVKQPIRDQDGSIRGLLGVSTEISERRAMEDRLRESEERLRAIFEVLPVGITITDPEGWIVDCNAASETLLGITREEHLARRYDGRAWSIARPDGTPMPAEEFASVRALQEQRPVLDVEMRVGTPAGETWLRVSAIPVRHPKYGVVIAYTDLSAIRRAERILADRERLLQAVFSQAASAITVVDPDSLRFIDVNAATARILGYSRDELLAMGLADIQHEIDENILRARITHVRRAGPLVFPARQRCKDGEVIDVEVSAAVIATAERELLVGIWNDVSARLRMEAELKRSNADLEQFAYAVSHDLRQPLRMVSSYLQLVERALSARLDDESRQFLDFAVDGAQRLDRMIIGLLDYSRIGRGTAVPEPIETRAVVDEVLGYFEPLLARSGGEIGVFGDWPAITGSRQQIASLLQNLIDNAIKFRQPDQPPKIAIDSSVRLGRWHFSVQDDGIGVDPAQAGRLFRVFARLHSRARFEGTGIGLALCRRIVERHGGEIRLESAGEGLGSTVRVSLPLFASTLAHAGQ